MFEGAKYSSKDIIVLSRDDTVIIAVEDETGRVTEEEYGFIDKADIYERINSGEELNLNRTYVKDFSIKEYIVSKNLKGDDHHVNLCFNLRNSFAGSKQSLDLSM